MSTPRRAFSKPAAPATPADSDQKSAKKSRKPSVRNAENAVEKTAKTLARKVAGKVAKAASLISGIVGKKSATTQPAAARATDEPARTKKATNAKKADKKADKAAATEKAGKAVKPKVPAGKKVVPSRAGTTKAPTKATTKATTAKTAAAKPAVKAGKVAKPVKPSRPTAFTARDVERPYGFSPETPELPSFYGEDRFVLMTKDPDTLFAYWEITPARKTESEKAMRQGAQYQEALRLNWPARALFENNVAVFPITFASRKWYVRVPASGLSYHADIGWLADDGHFIPLMTSNRSDAPESWDGTRRRLKGSKGFKGPAAGRALMDRAMRAGRPQGSSGLTSPTGADEEGDGWNFQGPGSQTSSSGTRASAEPARRAADKPPEERPAT